MNKKGMLFVALLILYLDGISYAAGPLSERQSAAGTKSMNPSQPIQFNRTTGSASNQSSDRIAKSLSTSNAAKRQAEIQKKKRELITFSRRAASDIRREINSIHAQKDKHMNSAEIRDAADMADKFDKFSVQLQREISLASNDPDFEQTLQSMMDMSEQLQLQLQDTMNKHQQLMQTMRNIMKKQNSTLKSIINNIK